MLRVHPTPQSGTAENRLSEDTQAPTLFLEVSAGRAEDMVGLGGLAGWEGSYWTFPSGF